MRKHLLITGANRGIGLTFVKAYLSAGWQVTACCRSPNDADKLLSLKSVYQKLTIVKLDLDELDNISLDSLNLPEESFDLVIHNAGYYGPKGVSFGQVNLGEWRKVLEINTLGPLFITNLLYPKLNLTQGCTLAFISSKVGSMADNGSGGGYYYRSSKAALNAVVKSLSIDLATDGVKSVALHPGWVLTDMGGPNALIDTETSVQGMMQVIDKLSFEQSGSFIDYQGKTIPW
ncbi:SDR family oxidoreductase [Shewanella pneumatophori]|uniref:SDR family oxidoreductase n=1 Tax=Shewanella pneumatophori TaxID=314092 RepID=A0A9X1ZDC2_9GAMM|nr:SDR family oxidoreductase [Shewanella pneumatophori]MCL1137275.1 SDR family oxidoreductase [Shewanella pneumatophori]